MGFRSISGQEWSDTARDDETTESRVETGYEYMGEASQKRTK